MNNKIEAIVSFCDGCVDKKVVITLTTKKTFTGKLISANLDKVVISKEENFFIVGKEDRKYSSKFFIDTKSIHGIEVAPTEPEKKS